MSQESTSYYGDVSCSFARHKRDSFQVTLLSCSWYDLGLSASSKIRNASRKVSGECVCQGRSTRASLAFME